MQEIRPSVPDFYKSISNEERAFKSLIDDVKSSMKRPGSGNGMAEDLPQVTVVMSAQDLREHPVFPQIIELGEPAVPHILEEYKNSKLWLNEALKDITGENPNINLESHTYENERNGWVKWGENRYKKMKSAAPQVIFDHTKITPFPAGKAV